MQLEGKKLGERYQVISRIGGGGMATVYKAQDVLLHRFVAIKVLSESLSNDSEFVRRFSREAQAVASLSHPNIVNVYDVGQDNHLHYIVMELVEGCTLKQYIQEKGPIPAREAANIAVQICDGLSHAHENQIVHRDIKPHNILIDKKGRAKVTDFGIARAASSSTITQTGSVMGSVHYFSPEQARGGVIREKADIYSLGVVMYEMLTGELPFDGDSGISIALKHLQEPVVDPRELNPDVPENIVRIVMRALEKEPEMRYTSAKAMMQDISYALQLLDDHGPPQWLHSSRNSQTEDTFQTIPLIDDDPKDEDIETQPIAPSVNRSTAAEAAKSQGFHNFRSKQNDSQVDDEKLKNRFRNVSNNKDKTIFQRTVVWLDNAQAKMPWWQKILFGFLTIIIIFVIAIFGFSLFWNWLSGGDEETAQEKPPTQQEQQAKQEDQNKKPQGIQVMNFTGMWQSKAEEMAQTSEKDLGYKIDVSNSRCYNKNTTDQDLKPGQILESYPQAGESVEPGGTVYLWIYVPKAACNDLPPSKGGKM